MRNAFHIVASWLTVLALASCAQGTPLAPTSKAEVAGSAPAASTPKPSAAVATQKPAAQQPKYGGVLTVAAPSDPASFDLHQESGAQHIIFLPPAYNGLLQFDPFAWPEAKITPDLAASWETSSDGLEYTFRLKDGVRWHDGRPLTSEDIKISLDRVREPPRGIRSPRQASLGSIAQLEAVSNSVVKIRLRQASASLSSMLATHWLSIFPKHVLDARGDMKRDVVGTGPFKFKEYASGVGFELVKNDGYFVSGRPYLNGIKVYIIKDDATRFAALRTGRVLFQPYPYGLSVSQARLAKSEPNLATQTNWFPGLNNFRFNLQRSAPWSDPRVRQAISLAIDRQAFVETVLEGLGFVGTHLPSKDWSIPLEELLKMPGYRQPKDADLAEAKKLLAEAGFPQGFSVSLLTRSEEMYQKMTTFLQAELAKIGVKATSDTKVTAAFDDALARGAFDTVSAAVATSLDDPDTFFGENYVTGGGRNYGKYSNPKFDELYLRQAQTLDVAERKKVVRQMLTILEQDNPDVALAVRGQIAAHSSRVRNWKVASSPQINNQHQETWLAD